MAVYRPGRLRRVLGNGTMWNFSMYSAAMSAYDGDIQTVTIRRGKSGRGGGVHPATMEITVNGAPVLGLAGSNVRFFLREEPAARLAARVGTTAAAIATRYTGRIGQSSVEDTGRRFATTYSAASWITRLNHSPKAAFPKAGQDLKRVINDLTHQLDSPLAGVNVTFHGDFDTLAADDTPLLFKDGITKYTADLGLLVRETRGGVSQVLTLPYRAAHAAAAMKTAIPLIRSQAISPARWEQRNEWPPQIIDYQITNPNGAVVTRTAQISTGSGETAERVAKDWSYIKPTTDQLSRHAYGMVYETNTRQYSVPSVTVDLLHLISSPNQYHRDQAGQLLAMEAGDPVFFAGDWPDLLRGIHFAEGVTETIGPDTWTLELSLVPHSHAVGDTTPVVPARVWESAVNRWNEEPRIWSAA